MAIELRETGYLRLCATGAPSKNVPVTDAGQASRTWESYRDAYGLGGRDLKRGCGDLVDSKGKVVAKVSYNGRVWNLDGSLLWDNGCGLKMSVANA